MSTEIINRIELRNVAENMFAEQLNIQVEMRLVEEFAVSAAVQEQSQTFEDTPWYALHLIGTADQVVDIWYVDTRKTITTKDGRKINRSGELDQWLGTIEAKYHLSRNLLNGRPGDNYFALLSYVNEIDILEITVPITTESVNKVIADHFLRELIMRKSEIRIAADAPAKYEPKYVISLYSKEESILYTLHVDAENNVYTGYGYALTGDFITGWIEAVLKSCEN